MKKFSIFILLFIVLMSLTACQLSQSETYSITFDSNGGSIVTSIEAGELPSSIPVKDGYKFSGWFLDQAFNYPAPFYSILIKDITVYAKWIEENQALTETDIQEIIANYPFESLDLEDIDPIYLIELYEDYIFDMISNARKSVVMIDIYDGYDYMGGGSGVIIDKIGSTYYVLTNHHVVDGSEGFDFEMTLFGTSTDYIISDQNISLLWKDVTQDLALMTFTSTRTFVPIEFADINDIRVGESVYAIGSPLDLPNTTTSGIISKVNRPMWDNDGMNTIMIQHTAGINPGNSGGALIDIYGRLVGINTMAYVDEYVGEGINNLFFSVQIDRIIDTIESYE
ncbi:MAG: trypsin-like peptidase domain-containing protein [Acholeplasmataceae bacterium]|nr:trypsin-like peptidase domain-containing protein [Acholeplasmataceae bacterium]